MYLSQLILNERQPQVYGDLGNAHRFHQRIMQAFPDEVEREKPRQDWNILFRHEPDSEVVLVQSDIAPDWSRLPENYLLHSQVKEVHLTVEQLAKGRIFRFRLRTNPSKRDKATRKIIGFFRSKDQKKWLHDQGKKHGFSILGHNDNDDQDDNAHLEVIPSPSIFGIKEKGTSPIRIHTVLFQGILQVTNPEAFIQVMQKGIGRGRSYGCGLLSLMRVN